MNLFSKLYKNRVGMKFVCLLIAFCFSFSYVIPSGVVYAQVLSSSVAGLPPVGTMVSLSDVFAPAVVKGITIHPDNPFEFDFIIDTGDSGLTGEGLRKESVKLIKYFLSALTIPDDEMWVNLSPYQKDKIVPDGFGKTDMGRDLLAQDYLLKQLTASIVYPESEIGKRFWDRVYAKAKQLYGVDDIPMNTFNKVWIVADRAVVYEKDNTAYVVDSHLKVMMEEDYIALQRNLGNDKFGMGAVASRDVSEISKVSADVMREVVLPELEKEVNEGKNFARLRAIYNSVILASWYKDNLRRSLLGQVYVNKGKLKGVEIEDKDVAQKIYKQYLEAFKKGVYNYIKEDFDEDTKQVIPRKYFSGGTNLSLKSKRKDLKSIAVTAEDRRLIMDGLKPSSSNSKFFKTSVALLEIGPDTALTDSEIAELPESLSSSSVKETKYGFLVDDLVIKSRKIIKEMQQAFKENDNKRMEELLDQTEVFFPKEDKSGSAYLFAISANKEPNKVDVDRLSDEEVYNLLLKNASFDLKVDMDDARLLKYKQPFSFDTREQSEHNRGIYKAALKSGLLGIHYIITNIKRFSPVSHLSYIEFLQDIVNQYNGNLVILLYIEKIPTVMPGDGTGMAMALQAVESRLSRDFLEKANIDIITDGGLKSRGGNWTGKYGYNGMMPTQYGEPYYSRAITTLGCVRLQHKNYGENRIYWTASDGDYVIGNLEYGINKERDLEDDDTWSMVIHGIGVEIFDEKDKEYVFGKLEQAWEDSNGDEKQMLRLLESDSKIKAIIDYIKEKKLDSLGENFSDPITGKLLDFKEKPSAVEILWMLRNFNTNKIIPNAFLVVFNRKKFLDQIDYYKHVTLEGKRFTEYSGSYFKSIIQSQFSPEVLKEFPIATRDLFKEIGQKVFPKETIIAASLGKAGDFTDRGKTDFLSEGYLEQISMEEGAGRYGVVKRGNVFIGNNVTLHAPLEGVAILENVIIDADGPVELWLSRGDYIQNSILHLSESMQLQENTVIVDSHIKVPLNVKGGDVRIIGVSGTEFYDLGPSGWKKVASLDIYPDETIVSILTTGGFRYINRTITRAPYKGVSLRDIVGGDISEAARIHPRLVGIPNISDSEMGNTELIKLRNWMGADGENLSITQAKASMDYVSSFREIQNIKKKVWLMENNNKDEPFHKKEIKKGNDDKKVSSSTEPPGGIDLNPALLDLQIKRDDSGVPLPISQQPLNRLNIQGFIPVITNIVPMQGLMVTLP